MNIHDIERFASPNRPDLYFQLNSYHSMLHESFEALNSGCELISEVPVSTKALLNLCFRIPAVTYKGMVWSQCTVRSFSEKVMTSVGSGYFWFSLHFYGSGDEAEFLGQPANTNFGELLFWDLTLLGKHSALKLLAKSRKNYYSPLIPQTM
ncbi:hypothetical protein C5167_002989 [Papaver somniferum]|uniref:Uncharacterized protein n=1 Tax=Papaver somniferum TaxID=3469 RepID=A0A4Y7L3D2_PAPSO|nr:hypothetical protein C5167_002989 [Papaver somniferum]